MKNEKENEEEVKKSSSSTSEVLESIDLTLRATTSTEPHILNLKTSETDSALQITKIEIAPPQKTPKRSHVVAEVLNSVLDAITHQIPTTSRQHSMETTHEERFVRYLTTSQPNLRTPKGDIRVYRSVGGGIINSTSTMHNENYVRKTNSKISLKRVPPSYSTVLKLDAPLPHYDNRTYSSIPFIIRQPPPSYAEVHGGWDDSPSIVSSDSFSLGPNPGYVACPRCRTVVISDTHSERSHLTYIASLLLCVCMCWPCCLMPFCVKGCRNTYHFCPTCNYYLGVYRPC